MDGTDKINEMVGDVQEDGRTVLLDEKPAEAEAEVKTEPAKTPDPLNLNTPETKAKEETGKKLDKSFLLDTEAEPEATRKDRTVPVREIQKERAKRQAAEQENAELKAKLEAQTKEVVVDGDLVQQYMDDPNDLIDGKTAMKLAQQTADRAVKNYADSIEQGEANRQTQAQRESVLDKTLDAARQKYGDFDQVTTQAIENGYISEQERRDIAQSKNPAALLYAKSKERLAVLGNTQPSVSGSNQPVNEPLDTETETDAGIYEVLRD